MIPRKHIEGILSLAVKAPSGDNSQPWRFEVRNAEVDLYNISGKDYSPYNFRERGSLFANGALIENLVIAATSFGYAAEIKLFPEASNREHIAHIIFLEQGISEDPLVGSIVKRATNRKPYRKDALGATDKERFLSVVKTMNFGKLLLLEDRDKIAQFANVVSLSDQLIFEEKNIHDAIFGSIRWSKDEEEKKKGMYIETLELPPPARALFKMLKSWSTLSLLNKIGISRFIASQSAKVYASSSAIGMIVIPDSSDESYVKAGRLFERLWLTATQHGINIHPVTALAYLAERVAAHDAGELLPAHAEQVATAQKKIDGLFGDPYGPVAMMFRVGYGDAVSAHSRKDEPNVIYG